MGERRLVLKKILIDNPGHRRPGITGLGHIHPWGLALWTSCPIGSKGLKTPGAGIPKGVALHPLVLGGGGR